MHVHPTIFDRC